MELFKTDRLKIRPATFRDKRNVYNWLACSNLTAEMLGPPNFPDAPIPTWAEFEEDFLNHYFDGSKPLSGRCFIVTHAGQEIGQISYNAINTNTKSTEIDIWLADRKYTGKGYGSEAISWICQYLKDNFHCETIFIAPSKRNRNAIKAYKKAGFTETDKNPINFIPDYEDAIVLKREMQNKLP